MLRWDNLPKPPDLRAVYSTLVECHKSVTTFHSSPESCVWRFADFVLDRDQEVGVRIFMRPPAPTATSGEPRADDVEWDEKVLNLVQRYPEAHVAYLEHVVLENDSAVEKFHTQLASTYLDRMLVLKSRLQLQLPTRLTSSEYFVNNLPIEEMHIILCSTS